LTGVLKEALASSAVPEAQQERASEALLVIGYQLARCHQQTKDCQSAADVYSELLATTGLTDGLMVKFTVRAAEARVCMAENAVKAGDAQLARAHLDTVSQLLSGVVGIPLDEVLSEELAADLETVQNETLAKQETLDAQRKGLLVASTEELIRSKECVGAETALTKLPGEDIDQAELTRLRGELDVACPPESEGPDMTYVALGAAGLGGALLLTAVVLEIAGAGDIDDFDSARGKCLGGNPASCQTALNLKDDIESQQVTTSVLVGVGVAAAAGGVIWWLMIDGEESEDAQVMLAPTLGPDSVGTQLTLRW